MDRGFLAVVLGIVTLACGQEARVEAPRVFAVSDSELLWSASTAGRWLARCTTPLRVFRGMPFAQPPTGGLRWRPPQPMEPWAEVRSATRFGPSCQQPSRSEVNRDADRLSEDCLTINVWTPAQSPGAQLPVMVWIHGGGFVRGSGDLGMERAARLAKRDVVLVSFNYRLGIFGFFSHPALMAATADEHEGNYGLMDMTAALEWVQSNIDDFGGDPDNVTIFGVSAGGMAVNCLMAMPGRRDSSTAPSHRAAMAPGRCLTSSGNASICPRHAPPVPI